MGNEIRILRLENDNKALLNIDRKSPHISIEPMSGRPPYKYLITYSVKGYLDQSGATRSIHHVEMTLPEGYPVSDPPQFIFRESLWHPNVFADGKVCLGLTTSNWNFGYDIDQLIYDVGNMVRFAPNSINLKSIARMNIGKDAWKTWINSHQAPLADIDFNVSDSPVIKIKEKAKKPEIKILPLKEKPKIKVTLK
jgi:ubiquitin-protein ligase